MITKTQFPFCEFIASFGTIAERTGLNASHRCVALGETLVTDLIRTLLHLKARLVPDLHLHNGLAHGRHGAHDVEVLAFVREAAAFSLLPHEALLLLVVIHLLVQLLVALFAVLVDSHGHPVLVHVVVVGHREHYS